MEERKHNTKSGPTASRMRAAISYGLSYTAPKVMSQMWQRTLWRQMAPLLGQRRTLVAALAITSALCGVVEAGLLALVAQVATALVERVSRVSLTMGLSNVQESVGVVLILAFVLAGVRFLLQVLVAFLPARIAADVQLQLRSEIFGAFIQASWPVQSRDQEGHMQEMSTNHVEQASLGALYAAQLVAALCTFIAMVASAIAINLLAAGAVLTASVGLFFVLRPLGAVGIRSARERSHASVEYAAAVNESVRLAEETQVLGVAAAYQRRMDHLAKTTCDFSFKADFVGRLVPSTYQSAVYLFVVAGLAGLYVTGNGHLASLGAVILVLVRAGSYGQQVATAHQATSQALPYLNHVQETTARYVRSREIPGHGSLNPISTLEFEDVCFAYETSRSVLSRITFQIMDGETVGVVGPSGTGKSTMVQILLRLRHPDAGQYRVNGICADNYIHEDWCRAIAYVPQEPRLLHASVSDNIRHFRTIDASAVEDAARLAGIHDDIIQWPNGYDTIVGPRADAVSGGQQQRLCLARALAAQPQLLVLDEPTSALDPHSEALIQHSLVTLKHRMIIVIVAHRMSTLEICDRVMVIADGRLDAFDTLLELRRTNQYYRLASSVGTGRAGA